MTKLIRYRTYYIIQKLTIEEYGSESMSVETN